MNRANDILFRVNHLERPTLTTAPLIQRSGKPAPAEIDRPIQALAAMGQSRFVYLNLTDDFSHPHHGHRLSQYPERTMGRIEDGALHEK